MAFKLLSILIVTLSGSAYAECTTYEYCEGTSKIEKKVCCREIPRSGAISCRTLSRTTQPNHPVCTGSSTQVFREENISDEYMEDVRTYTASGYKHIGSCTDVEQPLGCFTKTTMVGNPNAEHWMTICQCP